jgi:hypothetical protein
MNDDRLPLHKQKVELEEAFSAPTFGRTATAAVRNLPPALDFAADRASAARI